MIRRGFGMGDSIHLVDPFAQGLAGFEVWHQLFGDQHLLARAWVAAHAGRATVDRKAAKAADFDAMPLGQRFRHGVQNGLDRKFGITLRKLTEALSQAGNQVGSCHVLTAKNSEVVVSISKKPQALDFARTWGSCHAHHNPHRPEPAGLR